MSSVSTASSPQKEPTSATAKRLAELRKKRMARAAGGEGKAEEPKPKPAESEVSSTELTQKPEVSPPKLSPAKTSPVKSEPAPLSDSIIPPLNITEVPNKISAETPAETPVESSVKPAVEKPAEITAQEKPEPITETKAETTTEAVDDSDESVLDSEAKNLADKVREQREKVKAMMSATVNVEPPAKAPVVEPQVLTQPPVSVTTNRGSDGETVKLSRGIREGMIEFEKKAEEIGITRQQIDAIYSQNKAKGYAGTISCIGLTVIESLSNQVTALKTKVTGLEFTTTTLKEVLASSGKSTDGILGAVQENQTLKDEIKTLNVQIKALEKDKMRDKATISDLRAQTSKDEGVTNTKETKKQTDPNSEMVTTAVEGQAIKSLIDLRLIAVRAFYEKFTSTMQELEKTSGSNSDNEPVNAFHEKLQQVKE